jgi:radical SAM-linked protein
VSQPERYRYRIKFSKTQAMRFTSHLDLHRAWERTFRRAEMPLTYSQGYNPRPKINLASALPLGFTSCCELIDVWFDEALPEQDILARLRQAAPPGIQVTEVQQIDLRQNALQQSLIAAEYQAFIDEDLSTNDLAQKAEALLSQDSIPRRRRGKDYDLRPLIETLTAFSNEDDQPLLEMKLTALEGATGRPDEVLEALGLDPLAARIERTALHIAS